eukprot:6074284-Pleurochrysis_carterae.AAC.3
MTSVPRRRSCRGRRVRCAGTACCWLWQKWRPGRACQCSGGFLNEHKVFLFAGGGVGVGSGSGDVEGGSSGSGGGGGEKRVIGAKEVRVARLHGSPYGPGGAGPPLGGSTHGIGYGQRLEDGVQRCGWKAEADVLGATL